MKGLSFRRREALTRQPDDFKSNFIRPNFRAAAELVTKDIRNKFAGLMADIRKDRSLNQFQRAAALLALRVQREIEIQAARKKTIDEEAQKEKAYRQHIRALKAAPLSHPKI